MYMYSLKVFVFLSFFFLSFVSVRARDYTIYSISQDVPMGIKDEVLKKNYFIDMGRDQGLEVGTKLHVYRKLSNFNPYQQFKQYTYKFKVGEIEVLHSEKNSAIAKKIKFYKEIPQLEYKDFMIGDMVDVLVKEPLIP